MVRDPCGDSAVAFDERDIAAAVAVTALLDDAHIGQVHEITGLRLLTRIQRTRIPGWAIGRPLPFEPQQPGEPTQRVTPQGYPPEYATAILDFGEHFGGNPDRSTPPSNTSPDAGAYLSRPGRPPRRPIHWPTAKSKRLNRPETCPGCDAGIHRLGALTSSGLEVLH
ncbi:hypothetical protein [Thermomonospora umbrina]|uniref:Uncharacterized protein n=1 Tax=Thermomonospora umbrina TaxID=111806 RepID=A0A3D9SGP3_9ACTN|nr:hypothetical protein [Thermomonospora umbrina]REE95088.1 hypothetical protein DFJ69_0468 [Thermomonospora umbrina]